MKMIVSRRAYLLAGSSQPLMRAAARANAAAARRAFDAGLEQRHADMLRRAGVPEAEIVVQSRPIAV